MWSIRTGLMDWDWFASEEGTLCRRCAPSSREKKVPKSWKRAEEYGREISTVETVSKQVPNHTDYATGTGIQFKHWQFYINEYRNPPSLLQFGTVPFISQRKKV